MLQFVRTGVMILNICICDDDKLIHETLKTYCYKIYDNTQLEIDNLFSAEELIHIYEQQVRFDIIFLDIEMATITGIEAAEKIKKISPDVIIIFISSHQKYVFDTFKVEPLHFLVKPFSEQEFNDVFKRALNKYRSLNSTITLKWQNERYVIKINTIKYIEGYKRHITVYTQNEKYEALGKIQDMQKILSSFNFIRTHQGFLVNMDYIHRFTQTDVILSDGTKVMISVRKRAEALRMFDEFLKRKKW